MIFKRNKKIYLDYAAATPVLPEVRSAMDKYWSQDFYNPSSVYDAGVRVRREVEECRKKIAHIIGAGAKDIVFTASGTESVNLAILGTFEAFRELYPKKRGHIIVSAIEHPAVMEAAHEVKRRGGRVSVVGVNEEGLVSPEDVRKLLRPDTFLVSIMIANNEIGTIQPIAKIGRLLKREMGEHAPYLHTDASQAANYLDVSMTSLNADLLTLDGSKIYGPKGIGILAVRPRVTLRPITLGGGQERGLRSGTENPALIAGFARALEIAVRDREQEAERIKKLKERFLNEINLSLPAVIINGSPTSSLPNIISISIPGILSEMIVLGLDREGIMASSGSACSGVNNEGGSAVIATIGRENLAESTVRFSLGRDNTEAHMVRVAKIFCRLINRAKISA